MMLECTAQRAAVRNLLVYRGGSTRAPVVEQKTPKRSTEAVREATKLSMHGYQGKSTTKLAPPKKRRVPLTEKKTPKRPAKAVQQATVLSMHGYQGNSTTKAKD
eukprot:CAMPEP_0119310958 /NCGR_PEP_ID=MMETSP1333-20130426/21017_1 /TAXON_ID=418940 /ORGANISM="Scyphosphaera apsteinii, Strain RCC1455" /LENGTH=103 /DNA_ID=CAMNT_0007315229 /DNA_START=97 /DNA_END=408 /DNA_ORIENTATION=+